MTESEKTYLKTAWKNAATRLRKAEIKTPLLDSRLLLQNVLKITYEQLLIMATRELTDEEIQKFGELILRRLKREPVAKILEEKEFWGVKFKTTIDTLDPRPETETLIEALTQLYKEKDRPLKILDLGTGTGCIIISLLKEYPNATGVAVDKSLPALQIARENAERNNISDRCDFVQSDWFSNVSDKYDIIVSNPPYIKSGSIQHLAEEISLYEPKLALEGGDDGLDAYRKIISEADNFLVPHGKCFFEIGKWQEEPVVDIIHKQGLQVSEVWEDLAGIPRLVIFHKQFLKVVK